MIELSQEEFERHVSRAIDSLPDRYATRLDNVAFVTEDIPTEAQRIKMKLRHHETLFGLYEGIPQTSRGAGYSLVLPDKITIFKKPLEYASQSVDDLFEKIRKTVWHEVAHHFGLDHEQIDRLGGS